MNAIMNAILSGEGKNLSAVLVFIGLLALSAPAQAAITANPSSVNFAAVAVGASSTRVNVTLTNNGTRRVNISSVSVSSPQFSYVGPASFTIRPSSSFTVGVAFSPAAAQSYSGTLILTANGGRHVTISLAGTGTSATPTTTPTTTSSSITLTIDPPSATLAPGATQTFIAATHGGNNTGITWNATCGSFTSDGWYGFYTAPSTAGSCSVTGRMTYDLSVSVSAQVTVASPTVTAPSITSQPVSRTVAAGQTASFTVAASGTSPFSYQWTKNGVPVSGATSSSYTTPATTTADNGAQFAIAIGNSAGNTVSNAATLSVTAPALLLSMSPASLAFGNVDIGSSIAKTLVVTNSGTGNVTIAGLSYSGPGFGASGLSSGLVLGPAQSASLNASFAPSASGTVSGNVTVTSNATNSPATASLSGSGVQIVSHQVSLSWNPGGSTAVGYQVYSSTVSGGPYTRLTASAVPATGYTDLSVHNGSTYYYVVTSVDSNSRESAYSSPVPAVIP